LPCLPDLEVGNEDLEKLRRLVTLPPLVSGAGFGEDPLAQGKDGRTQPYGPVTSPLLSRRLTQDVNDANMVTGGPTIPLE
jgi:hypothetical protein